MDKQFEIITTVSIVPIEEIPNHQDISLITDEDGNVTKVNVSGTYFKQDFYFDIAFSAFKSEELFNFLMKTQEELMVKLFDKEHDSLSEQVPFSYSISNTLLN